MAVRFSGRRRLATLANTSETSAAALADASQSVTLLRARLHALRAATSRELGVRHDGPHGCARVSVPLDDLRTSMDALERVLQHRLGWWTLPWRADDVSSELGAVVRAHFLRALEKQVTFDAGRAVALQRTLDGLTDEAVSTRAFARDTGALYSAVLVNSLAQVAHEQEPRGASAARELSAPIERRRRMIMKPSGPLDVLQRKAQKLTVSSLTLASSSALAAVLAQGAEMATFATNAGLGALGATLAAWWLQRGWLKACKRFRKDVGERIVGGLEVDLAVRALCHSLALSCDCADVGVQTAAEQLLDRCTYRTRTAIASMEAHISERARQAQPAAVAMAEKGEMMRTVEAEAELRS